MCVCVFWLLKLPSNSNQAWPCLAFKSARQVIRLRPWKDRLYINSSGILHIAMSVFYSIASKSVFTKCFLNLLGFCCSTLFWGMLKLFFSALLLVVFWIYLVGSGSRKNSCFHRFVFLSVGIHWVCLFSQAQREIPSQNPALRLDGTLLLYRCLLCNEGQDIHVFPPTPTPPRWFITDSRNESFTADLFFSEINVRSIFPPPNWKTTGRTKCRRYFSALAA